MLVLHSSPSLLTCCISLISTEKSLLAWPSRSKNLGVFPRTSFSCRECRSSKRHLWITAATAASSADYYQALGVPKTATKQEIKASYRKLALELHPDVNKAPEAEEMFKDICAAYEVLSDDQKRQVYDSYGSDGLDDEAPSGSPFDIFEDMFQFRGGWVDSRGDDTSYELTMDFKEAVFGVEKQFDVWHWESCDTCSGTGSKSKRRKKCRACGGAGEVIRSFGFFEQIAPCPSCDGEGEFVSDKCKKCGGKGSVRAKKSIRIDIPCGVDSGSTLRVAGGGDAGDRGAPAGDLYVNLKIKEIPGIRREGIHLYSDVTLSYTNCILGSTMKVKTLEGVSDLRVPAGTQPGGTLVLHKMGVPRLNKPSQRGDHFFVVTVSLPKKLSEREKELVEELARLEKDEPRSRRHQRTKTRVP